MSYFMGSIEVPITGTGTTVSSEDDLTADCLAIASPAQTSYSVSLAVSPPELFAVATVGSAELDIYSYSTRECFAIAAPAVAELDIGLRTNELLYYDPVYEA